MSGAGFIVLLALAWLGFTYGGYAAVLFALRRLSPRPIRGEDTFPSLSIIIAAHDAGRALAPKLEATLALDYSGDREILVSSDGSTDETVAVARSFEDRGVVVIESLEHAGKEAAQARAIARARGELLVFTDVGAELEPGALRAIARPFADPRVGCVSSEDALESEGGEGLYVRHEMALRRLESEASTLVGLSGSCFAVRRSLADTWPTDLASDFRSALEAARRGLRCVAEPAARARLRATDDLRVEWRRKLRTVRRGLEVLSRYTDLLHPRHGRVALSLWGHKVARFTSPFALLLLLVGSALGASQSGPLAALFLAQLFGYGLGIAALLRPELRELRLPRLAAFFVLVNAAMLVAWGFHWTGRPVVAWKPTPR